MSIGKVLAGILAAAVGGVLLGLAALPARAAEAVDLELVIATDVSRSIDESEATLQREGIAAAFRDKDVIRAIQSGFLRRIAVVYMDYSSRFFNKVVIDWRIVDSRESAEAFSDALLKAPLTFGRRTSISDAIERGAELIENNNFEGTRRVIDVSGDGPNNHGRLVDHVRNETVAKRITINGLPIMNDGGQFVSRFYIPDLDKYYQGCVIGGAGAFVVVANNFKDFARAIRKKLILEIAGVTPGEGPVIKASAVTPATYHSAQVYERGCDIGERMRGSFWDDDP